MENQALAATELSRQASKNELNKGRFLLKAWHPLEALWRGRHSLLGKGKHFESHKMQRARTWDKGPPLPLSFPLIVLQLGGTGLVLRLGELYLSFMNGLPLNSCCRAGGEGWGSGLRLKTVPL